MKDRCPTKPVYYVISGGVARTRLLCCAVAAADDTASSAGYPCSIRAWRAVHCSALAKFNCLLDAWHCRLRDVALKSAPPEQVSQHVAILYHDQDNNKQEIRANAHETPDSISLISCAACLGLSPVI